MTSKDEYHTIFSRGPSANPGQTRTQIVVGLGGNNTSGRDLYVHLVVMVR